MITFTEINAPVGRLLLAGNDEGLWLIEFERPRHPEPRVTEWEPGDTALLRETRRQLVAYFAGRQRTFDLPIATRGTLFQRRVWHALREIPYGTTRSYADIARQLGTPNATRAVGAANGRNPVPIIVPCHRVLGSDGSLTGFGGGIETKRFLLRLEGAAITRHAGPQRLRLASVRA
jgi:methylated-DNA-[protein]-cysteine S-methyltransferase